MDVCLGNSCDPVTRSRLCRRMCSGWTRQRNQRHFSRSTLCCLKSGGTTQRLITGAGEHGERFDVYRRVTTSHAVFFSYSQVNVATSTFSRNCEALLVHSAARSLGRIGTGVNKGFWEMTADEANAYYSAELNKIVIPGGILSPPFFDGRLPTAFNFGAAPQPFRSSFSLTLTRAQAR